MASLAELARSADRYEGLRGQTDAERETRNRLIRELMDAGHSYKEIAAAARLKIPGVQAVLTKD
jgi:hypothetical protein